MKVQEVLAKTTQFFKAKGIETARLDAELLIAAALGWDRVRLYMNLDYPLGEQELSASRELVKRRSAGEPVAYILGEKGFFKLKFKVNSQVLIPRPETELLLEEALKAIPDEADGFIFDFGTGSGCLGLSLIHERKKLKLLAFDVSPSALEVAKENATLHGLQDRVFFIALDLNQVSTENFLKEVKKVIPSHQENFHLWGVMANPPYIAPDDLNVQKSVKDFEPHLALFSAESGLEHAKKWVSLILTLEEWPTRVYLELGSTQSQTMKNWLKEFKEVSEIQIIKDYAGLERHIYFKTF